MTVDRVCAALGHTVQLCVVNATKEYAGIHACYIFVSPFKGQRCQLVTLCHPRLTYIFNF